jgi:hypothetical protein
MSTVMYKFPLPGGTLKLCCDYGMPDIVSEPALIPELVVHSPKYWFEYEGKLPKELALALVRPYEESCPQPLVNGGSLLTFLESVNAH